METTLSPLLVFAVCTVFLVTKLILTLFFMSGIIMVCANTYICNIMLHMCYLYKDVIKCINNNMPHIYCTCIFASKLALPINQNMIGRLFILMMLMVNLTWWSLRCSRLILTEGNDLI